MKLLTTGGLIATVLSRSVTDTPTPSPSTPLTSINATTLAPAPVSAGWVYTLQMETKAKITKIPAGQSYLTVDFTLDGSKKLTAQEISLLKTKTKKLLSYLSIGEAEDYRIYWQSSWKTSPPSFLGKENSDWKGNYKVKYWDPTWQEIMFKIVDELAAAGWDGVYLDIIDGYYYWASDESKGEGVPPMNEAVTAKYMLDFVKEIARRGRAKNPEFLIFPQNGESILDYDTDGSYLHTVNGIGVEDVFYDETKVSKETQERLGYLKQFVLANKTVLSVDYVDDNSGCKGKNLERIKKYLTLAKQQTFLPFVGTSDRELKKPSTSSCVV